MDDTLARLATRIAKATGADAGLDADIAASFGVTANPVPKYTSSVDDCLALIGAEAPRWHWHVGHGPRGILPYASMTHDDSDARVEATAPTVPLALLAVLLKALAEG